MNRSLEISKDAPPKKPVDTRRSEYMEYANEVQYWLAELDPIVHVLKTLDADINHEPSPEPGEKHRHKLPKQEKVLSSITKLYEALRPLNGYNFVRVTRNRLQIIATNLKREIDRNR